MLQWFVFCTYLNKKNSTNINISPAHEMRFTHAELTDWLADRLTCWSNDISFSFGSIRYLVSHDRLENIQFIYLSLWDVKTGNSFGQRFLFSICILSDVVDLFMFSWRLWSRRMLSISLQKEDSFVLHTHVT